MTISAPPFYSPTGTAPPFASCSLCADYGLEQLPLGPESIGTSHKYTSTAPLFTRTLPKRKHRPTPPLVVNLEELVALSFILEVVFFICEILTKSFKVIFHWKLGSRWVTNATEMNANNMGFALQWNIGFRCKVISTKGRSHY